MKKYKFRGKRKDNNEWVYGYYWKDYPYECFSSRIDTTKHYIRVQRNMDWSLTTQDDFEVIPETLGQFTGQIDDSEQENEIYDNDIVIGTWLEQVDEYNSEFRSDTARVYWDDGYGQWMVKEEKTTGETYPLYDYCSSVVAIGNMVDNPELMEAK